MTMRKTLNKILGYNTLPFEVYHTCPVHGTKFYGTNCPQCWEEGWEEAKLDPNATCGVCGKLMKDCENKGNEQ